MTSKLTHDNFIYGRIHYHFHQKFSWEKLFIFQFFKMPRFYGWNGPLGVGWSWNGLSAITRCRATQAQDGLIDAVDFDAHDRFCLDGEKLMAVEGEYGAEGTICYTEQHTFQKIVSFLNPETKMPRFKAWTKTGLILEYGFTTDSSVEAQGRKDVMIWAVNKIQDTKGNYIDYTNI